MRTAFARLHAGLGHPPVSLLRVKNGELPPGTVRYVTRPLMPASGSRAVTLTTEVPGALCVLRLTAYWSG